jgi:hypothetical protein
LTELCEDIKQRLANLAEARASFAATFIDELCILELSHHPPGSAIINNDGGGDCGPLAVQQVLMDVYGRVEDVAYVRHALAVQQRQLQREWAERKHSACGACAEGGAALQTDFKIIEAEYARASKRSEYLGEAPQELLVGIDGVRPPGFVDAVASFLRAHVTCSELIAIVDDHDASPHSDRRVGPTGENIGAVHLVLIVSNKVANHWVWVKTPLLFHGVPIGDSDVLLLMFMLYPTRYFVFAS